MRYQGRGRSWVWLGIMAVAAGLLAGCGDDATNPEELVPGTYERILDNQVVVLELDDVANEFRAYFATDSLSTEVGDWTYTATEMTFTQDSYCSGQPGTYAYTVTSEELTLTAQDEPCPDNRATVLGAEWMRR